MASNLTSTNQNLSEKLPFKILGINHIGIAPKNPSQASQFFSVLGLNHLGDELVVTQKTLTRMYESIHREGDQETSGTRLELLLNAEGERGPIAQFLEKKGGGIHHIALTVDNIHKALRYLKDKNIRLIDEEPRPGAHHTKIAFIHPESAGGILIELCEC